MLARLAVLGVMAVAAIVKEPADKRGARGGAPGAPAIAIGGELLLDRLKHRRPDDRRVLPRMACAAVVELAEIDPVAQEMRERAVGERYAPDSPARAQPAPSRDDAALPQLALQRRERASRSYMLGGRQGALMFSQKVEDTISATMFLGGAGIIWVGV